MLIANFTALIVIKEEVGYPLMAPYFLHSKTPVALRFTETQCLCCFRFLRKKNLRKYRNHIRINMLFVLLFNNFGTRFGWNEWKIFNEIFAIHFSFTKVKSAKSSIISFFCIRNDIIPKRQKTLSYLEVLSTVVVPLTA